MDVQRARNGPLRYTANVVFKATAYDVPLDGQHDQTLVAARSHPSVSVWPGAADELAAVASATTDACTHGLGLAPRVLGVSLADHHRPERVLEIGIILDASEAHTVMLHDEEDSA
jgi:hypothetical protein